MMELTESQKSVVSQAIKKIHRIQRVTAYDKLIKARSWAGIGLVIGLLGLLGVSTGSKQLIAMLGTTGIAGLYAVLLSSLLLAFFTNSKLLSYTTEMKIAEAPINRLGLRFEQPAGSGLDGSTGNFRQVRSGYLVNQYDNACYDIAEFI